MTKPKVLIAGESWTVPSIHQKGFDSFTTTEYAEGAGWLKAALDGAGWEIAYQPSHVAARDFPATAKALGAFDCVILSDIGANTLLLHPDVWLSGKTVPNRLKLLREYVEMGGGLFMIGGDLSFQGINGAARYGRTAVEDVLPVTCLQVDDRVEIPEGFAPEIVEPNHPILAGLPAEWPVLLGINEVVVKAEPGVQLLARTPADQGSHPLLVTGSYGQGRTLVWTSDIGPHWLPETFVQWEGYGQLWRQSLAWLTAKA